VTRQGLHASVEESVQIRLRPFPAGAGSEGLGRLVEHGQRAQALGPSLVDRRIARQAAVGPADEVDPGETQRIEDRDEVLAAP
jgi:hypothetical protein